MATISHPSSSTMPTTSPFANNLQKPANKSSYGSQIVSVAPDQDFVSLNDPVTNGNGPDPSLLSKYSDYLCPEGSFDAKGEWQSNPSRTLVDGAPDSDYSQYELDPYAEGFDEESDKPSTLLREIESILASLLTQGLMRGYLTHRNPRFAIPGARLRGALPTGFPNVWQTIYARESEDTGVPGWVQPPPTMAIGGAAALAAGGRVVNLSGAKPVGVQ